MPEKRYIIPLSDVDRMIVRQDINAGNVIAFSVQLEVFLNGRWHKVIRFDSAHGDPHRHTFYPDGSEYKESMRTVHNNVALTQAQSIVRSYFVQFREGYKTFLERMLE